MTTDTLSTFEDVDIPALRLTVQHEPVSFEEAVARAVDGCYRAVVAVPVHALFASSSVTTMSRYIARTLVHGAFGSAVTYAPLAFGDDGAVVYVRATIALD